MFNLLVFYFSDEILLKDFIMNILHTVTNQQQVSSKLQNLQASCKEDNAQSNKLCRDELLKRLSPFQCSVVQEKATERYVIMIAVIQIFIY